MGCQKTTCTRVLPPSVPDSSGEIHIDYHRFTDRATSFNTSLNGFRTQQNFAAEADNRSKKNSKKSRLERSQVSVKCASIFHQYSMNVPSIFYQYSINVLSIFHHFPSIFHQFQGYESWTFGCESFLPMFFKTLPEFDVSWPCPSNWSKVLSPWSCVAIASWTNRKTSAEVTLVGGLERAFPPSKMAVNSG